MQEDFLKDLGALALSTRLKRLADAMQASAAQVLVDAGLDIAPPHVIFLSLLDARGPVGINDAAALLGVSQPAVTRTVNGLKAMDLVEVTTADADRRQRTVSFSPAGRALLDRLKPSLFPKIERAARALYSGTCPQFLDVVDHMEQALKTRDLSARVAGLDDEA